MTTQAAQPRIRSNFSVTDMPELVRALPAHLCVNVAEKRRDSIETLVSELNTWVDGAPFNQADATEDKVERLAAYIERIRVNIARLASVNDAGWWLTSRTTFELSQMVKSEMTRWPETVVEYTVTYQALYRLDYSKPWKGVDRVRLYLDGGLVAVAAKLDIALPERASIWWDEDDGFSAKALTDADRDAIGTRMLIDSFGETVTQL